MSVTTEGTPGTSTDKTTRGLVVTVAQKRSNCFMVTEWLRRPEIIRPPIELGSAESKPQGDSTRCEGESAMPTLLYETRRQCSALVT